MLRFILFVCLIGLSMGHGGESFMKKYAHFKIMASCIGKETVDNFKIRMKTAHDKCKGKDVSKIAIDIKNMLDQLRRKSSPFVFTKGSHQAPVYVPVPVYVNQGQAQFPFLQQSRTKRGAIDLSPEGIEKIREKMLAKVSNVTCVLKELNAIDANNQPNYTHFANEIKKWPIEQDLKEDFLEVMDQCRDFAMCIPVEKAKNPIKKELGTALAFMKCMHKKKEYVCVKNDLKTYAPLFGFDGEVDTEEEENTIDEVAFAIFHEDLGM